MASPFPADPKATPRRKPVEEQLRESELRAHAFLDNSPNLIFIKDKEPRYLCVNREFERALRVDRERIRGRKDHDVLPHEQASAFHANDLEVLTAGVPIEFEEVSQQEDGPHTSIVHTFPLFDAAGEIYAIGGIVTDITERKRSREAVQHSEERFRSVLDTATDAVASVDQRGQNHFCESGDN
jgi:PAS domain S-box-containing protein